MSQSDANKTKESFLKVNKEVVDSINEDIIGEMTYLKNKNDEIYDKLEATQFELYRANDRVKQLENDIQQQNDTIVRLMPGDEYWHNLMRTPVGWIIWLCIKLLRSFKNLVSSIIHGIKSLPTKLKENRNETKSFQVLEVPSFNDPQVSIIIPVYNQFEYTYNCIKSIINSVKDVSYEIIIGDDVSTDQTVEIGNYIKGLNVIRNEKNLKFLLNCNNAAKSAKGKYILFLNNDTEVKDEWLESLVELIESDESVGMVGSKLIYPNGVLQEAGGIVWKDGSAWNYGHGQDPEDPAFNYIRETDYISGASIMIRSSLWNELGGFDEIFVPAYCEDSDLAFQVRKAGYKVLYQPKSVVVHYEGVSNGTDTSTGVKSYQVVNMKKMYEKWKDELDTLHYVNGEHVLRAKDRCFKDKKMILVIDHYVPTYDKDAGSRASYEYIKMFVDKGFDVKFLPANYLGTQPYTSKLESLGVEVLYGDYYINHINDWIDENGKDIDYIFAERPHIAAKYINALQASSNAKFLYFGHDFHFLRLKREAELEKSRKLLCEAYYYKKMELVILRRADMSYYLSNVEIDAIKEIDPSIKVKKAPIFMFDEFLENNRDSKKNKDIIFVGGFAHTPNVDALKWFVEKVFPSIQEKLPDITLHVIGSNPSDEVKALDGNGVDIVGFVSDEELKEYYETCKLEVVPLRYGAGIKGKVIEGMYNGVPLITTDIGAEGIEGIEDIVSIENEADKFADEVVRLYNDNDRLDKMSRAESEYIKQNYNLDVAWDAIKEEFE